MEQDNSLASRNIFLIVGSVVFGVVVWFSVVMKEEYQVTIAAPLSIEQVPEGKAIRTPVPPFLQLKIRGTGWRLASFLWGSGPKLDFPMPIFHGTKRAITAADVAERIGGRSGAELVEMAPESVFVELDRAGRKIVPVLFDCQISCKEGYGQVGPVSVSPESVAVTGAESVLKEINGWPTVHETFDNVKSPIESTVPLAPSSTYVMFPAVPSVGIKVEVEPFAEKTISGVPVNIIAIVPDRELILIPPKIDVVVRGGIRQLSNLEPEDLHVIVSYRDVIADSSGTVDAEISAPAGIQVVSRKPEHLQYVVRKRLVGLNESPKERRFTGNSPDAQFGNTGATNQKRAEG